MKVPSEKTIALLLKKTTDPKIIRDELIAIAETQEKIEKINREMDKLQFNTDQKMKQLKEELINVRTTCSHPDQTYYPDPSGNSDSFYECNICGKQL